MSKTLIKICGLRRPEDSAAVNEVQPDYVGFVLLPGSKRYVTPETVKELRTGLAPGIRVVGVFVDEEPETVARLLEEGVIDIAQLHGHEDAAYLETLRRQTDKPLIQAFRIRSEADVQRAMESAAGEILLDAGAGDGKTFDWELLKHTTRPYFLAGGLNPENAAGAVKRLRPYAVDVSSGVEKDGFKDPDRIRDFVDKVRMEDAT